MICFFESQGKYVPSLVNDFVHFLKFTCNLQIAPVNTRRIEAIRIFATFNYNCENWKVRVHSLVVSKFSHRDLRIKSDLRDKRKLNFHEFYESSDFPVKLRKVKFVLILNFPPQFHKKINR